MTDDKIILTLIISNILHDFSFLGLWRLLLTSSMITKYCSFGIRTFLSFSYFLYSSDLNLSSIFADRMIKFDSWYQYWLAISVSVINLNYAFIGKFIEYSFS